MGMAEMTPNTLVQDRSVSQDPASNHGMIDRGMIGGSVHALPSSLPDLDNRANSEDTTVRTARSPYPESAFLLNSAADSFALSYPNSSFSLCGTTFPRDFWVTQAALPLLWSRQKLGIGLNEIV